MQRRKLVSIQILIVGLLLSVAQLGFGAPLKTTFVLGAGDVLEITVWGDESLSRPAVTVRPDGNVSFPLIGDIEAAGKTIGELRNEIEGKMQEYVSGAPVTVVLQQLGSTQVYVVGKVNRAGVYMMVGKMTVLQALSLAGGMTPYADTDDILVVRLDAEGSQKYIPFNYTKVVGGDGLEQNIALMPGDTILVP